MQRPVRPLLAILFTVWAHQVGAQEANPAFWLIMPLSQSVMKCSALGDEMRLRTAAAMKIAQQNSLRVIPTQTWNQIASISIDTSKTKSEEDAKDIESCEAFLATLTDEKFATNFRQYIAAQTVVPLSLSCMVKYQKELPALKLRWLSAFQRQGFSISARSIDESVLEASAPALRESLLPLSLSDCRELERDLFGHKFDENYGEAGIYQLFRSER